MMSNPNVDPAHWSFASPTDQKSSQIDANLRLATENVQPIRLRRALQELRQTLPDPRKVTAALLLATQQKYIEKIKASKVAQSEEEEKDDEDDKDDSGSAGTSNVGEISEMSSEEEEDEDNSDDGSDDDMGRSELDSGKEDDGTDEEGAFTTASLRHMNVKSGSQKKE